MKFTECYYRRLSEPDVELCGLFAFVKELPVGSQADLKKLCPRPLLLGFVMPIIVLDNELPELYDGYIWELKDDFHHAKKYVPPEASSSSGIACQDDIVSAPGYVKPEF